MQTLPISKVKDKLNEFVEAVSLTREQVTITKNGSPAAVLVGATSGSRSRKPCSGSRAQRPSTTSPRPSVSTLKARRSARTRSAPSSTFRAAPPPPDDG